MRIQELFDRPSEIHRDRNEEDFVRYNGFIDGDQLTVDFTELYEGSWKIEFLTGGRMDARGDKGGQEVEIFSTVMKAVREFVADRTPKMIVFTAAKEEFGRETGRARLYDRMVKRFASNAGYLAQTRRGDDSTVFVLKHRDSV